eukprot:5887-Heterococcus_DN1.PRE.4
MYCTAQSAVASVHSNYDAVRVEQDVSASACAPIRYTTALTVHLSAQSMRQQCNINHRLRAYKTQT